MHAFLFAAVSALTLISPFTLAQTEPTTASAADWHQHGVELHLQRRLDEASREYARTLAFEPPRAPSATELATIRRFAPRLLTSPSEPFGLKDAAAILHPSERLIAYHLFWDDDIDFPDDNDPCDHEVVWIGYSADGQNIERIWTYFHGRILEGGAAALEDARAHDQRARVNVQWGKHGSMPFGWEQLRLPADQGASERAAADQTSLLDYNRSAWNKLSTQGRQSRDNPMARRLGWPEKFAGTFEQFADFSKPVDLLTLLDQRKLLAVSRWNSAVINRLFLPYNFRPKTEWPAEGAGGTARAGAAPAPLLASPTLETLQLPPKTIFDQAMPRYPNVWFHVDASLVGSYDEAIRLVAGELRGPLRLREYNTSGEGCDFEVRLEHLQPWEVNEHRALQHSHSFHMRYYHSALAREHLERVTLPTAAGPRQYYRFAGSVHYEVEHTNPNHADVEICPYCGRTGTYQHLTGNLVEMVHDPLGLELLFHGTIRGQEVRFEDDQPRPFVGLGALSNRYTIDRHIFQAASGDRNTLRIGAVIIAPHPRLSGSRSSR